MKRKTIVIGLDGTPFSLIRQRMQTNPGSAWHTLLEHGKLIEISSAIPEVSSVAWASYLTGVDPSYHGLLGFVDRTPDPFALYFPNARSINTPTILERIHDLGGTVVSINVPATYPPRELRGLVVGGFLGVDLTKNVQPRKYLQTLEKNGYVIDTDPSLAYKDKAEFYHSLESVLNARIRIAWKALQDFNWDLFQLHIMETDRLFHFFWQDKTYSLQFDRLLNRIEDFVLEMFSFARSNNANLVLLSDHGFTRTKRVVFINRFLQEEGLLSFNGSQSLINLSSSTIAYALPPGRIFISMRGKEAFGRITPGNEYESVRESIISKLIALRDPLTNTPVFRDVVRKEEIYNGPFTKNAADILALPAEGVDLKADTASESIFQTPSTLLGTHTFTDAFLYSTEELSQSLENGGTIADAGQYVLSLCEKSLDYLVK